MAKKFQAKASFLQTLIFHLVTAIILSCILLCFYPHCFPSLSSPFFYISIPNLVNLFYSPKCLFIVVNIIVIFLLGESKIFGSRDSPTCPVNEIYDEYVKRRRNINRRIPSLHQEKIITDFNHEDKSVTNFQEEEIKQVIKEQVEEETFQEVLDQKEDEKAELVKENEAQPEEDEVILKEEEEYSEEKEREKEESVWPAEELNRRIEEFIARVNRQRWIEEKRLIESRVLVSCSA